MGSLTGMAPPHGRQLPRERRHRWHELLRRYALIDQVLILDALREMLYGKFRIIANETIASS